MKKKRSTRGFFGIFMNPLILGKNFSQPEMSLSQKYIELLRVPWKCSKSHFVLKLSRKNPQYGHKFWTAWAMQLKFLEFSILNETMKWWIFQGFYFYWLDMYLMNLVGMTLLLSLVMWCELVNFYFRLFFNF